MTHDLVSLFSSDAVSTTPSKRFVFAVTVLYRDVKVQGQLQTSTLLKDTSAEQMLAVMGSSLDLPVEGHCL